VGLHFRSPAQFAAVGLTQQSTVHQHVVQCISMVCYGVCFAVQLCLQVLLLSYWQDAFKVCRAVGLGLPLPSAPTHLRQQ